MRFWKSCTTATGASGLVIKSLMTDGSGGCHSRMLLAGIHTGCVCPFAQWIPRPTGSRGRNDKCTILVYRALGVPALSSRSRSRLCGPCRRPRLQCGQLQRSAPVEGQPGCGIGSDYTTAWLHPLTHFPAAATGTCHPHPFLALTASHRSWHRLYQTAHRTGRSGRHN
jgi:hypothetical protein